MRFKTWMENEAGLGAEMPTTLGSVTSPNRGSDTPASSEVKRTGLQPQVGAEEISTKQKDEQDKIQAIDAEIQRLDKDIPRPGKEESNKLYKFKSLWDKFKEKWEELKTSDDNDEESPTGSGLADTMGDTNFVNTMQQHPNMVPGGQALPPG